MKIDFDNTYVSLPDRFYHRQSPASVSSAQLIRVNNSLAQELNIDPAWLKSEEGVAVLAGNAIAEGSDPIATVYAAHQFGNWNPQLGDGRALLLGEVVSRSGQRFDIQLKGSGPTPYSRGGDGLAPLGPVLREYVVSEAMHALGVPTSRSLAAVTTGEQVYRETAMPGAVLTRVAKSHIRIGTFQFFAARRDTEALTLLADHVLQRHYSDVCEKDVEPTDRYRHLLRGVIANTAKLVSHWQQIGFIHGVMNTDNMLVSGETVDYGPCAFMDVYHPETVFSSIDRGARYAYQNQPDIAYWNLANFAQCLVPLLAENEEAAFEVAKAELDRFPDVFVTDHKQGMAEKLGFRSANDNTNILVRDLMTLMAENRMDYTLTFTRLATSLEAGELCDLPEVLQAWLTSWQTESPEIEVMRSTNPVVIPRNHQIEAVIQAGLSNDLQPFHELVDALSRPFDFTLADSVYSQPPAAEEIVKQTFCGT